MSPHRPLNDSGDQKERDHGRVLFIGMAAGNFLLVVLAIFFFWQGYHQVESTARQQTDTLVNLLIEDVESDYRTVDFALRGVVDELGGTHQPQPDEMDAWLNKISGHHPMLNILRIVDAAGNVLYGRSFAPGTKANIADRDYFIRLRDDPKAGLQITDPIVGRTTGKAVVVLARRLEDAKGKFIGVTIASIPVAHFVEKFSRVGLGPQDAILFRNAGMKIVARYPTIAQLPSGSPFATDTFRTALKAHPEAGRYDTGMQTPDGVDRMYSYARNADYGFYINVGKARQDVFAAWWRQTMFIAGVLLLFALSSGLLALRLRRHWHEQALIHTAMREQDARLVESLRIARLGYFKLDLRRQVWEASETLEEVYGIDTAFPRDASGWQRLIHPDDLAALTDHIDTVVIAQGRPMNYRFRILRPDGELRWLHAEGRLESQGPEQGPVIFGSVQDITEQHLAADALISSQARFQSFFDSAMIGMAVTSLDKGWLMVNPALCQILGYPAEVLITKTWAELTHPDDLAADATQFGRVLAGETDGYSMEKRFVRPDGQVVEAFISARAVRNADGGIRFFSASVQDITQRNAVQRSLQESARRIRLLANHAAAYIYELDLDRRINFVNRAFAGLTEAQVLGTEITAWFPEDQRLVISTVFDQVVVNHTEETLEYEIPDPAGVLRTYDAKLIPIMVDGSLSSVVLTANEITERKRFERQLLNSRELLRQFFDHFPGTAFVKDENLRVLMASAGFSAQLGLNPADMIGRSNEELFPGAFGESLSADDRRVLASGVTENFEESYGGRFYESTKFVIRQSEKTLLGGITVDVTSRSLSRQRTEALLSLAMLGGSLPEREFLREGLHLAEAISGSAIGFLHFVNEDQETIELVTWTEGALKGCQAAYDAHYPISQAGIWADCFRQRGPVMFNDYAGYAAKKGLPPGHAHLGRLISVPVIEEGRVRMMIGVGNKAVEYDDFDVQSVQLIGNDLWRVVCRQRAEAALKAHVAELTELNVKLSQAQNQLLQSEKMATIGQLAAGVAHELNNPIGFIQSNLGTLDGYIDDLLAIIDHAAQCSQSCTQTQRFDQFKAIVAEKDLDFLRQDVRDLLAESKDGADRVRKIVQNLKDFSHVSEEAWAWADLHQGLESTLRLVWNEIKYKAEVEKQFGVIPSVFCMASQLNQVFMNLLVNAAQAIEGTGKITLRSGVESDEQGAIQGVWIEIQDTGKGIPAENLQRIFDPFFTTKPVGQGTGLGLSLAWSIVQKHHGTFTVDSQPGVGTTFRITLPLNGQGNSEGAVRNE